MQNRLENQMEEPTLAARDVLMAILPQFLHFVKSYCKSSLNLGKTYRKFTESGLCYVKKSRESNGRSYTGRTNRFDGYFTPIPPFCGIFFEIGPKSKSNLVESIYKQLILCKKVWRIELKKLHWPHETF